jgi:hypothetical protein
MFAHGVAASAHGTCSVRGTATYRRLLRRLLHHHHCGNKTSTICITVQDVAWGTGPPKKCNSISTESQAAAYIRHFHSIPPTHAHPANTQPSIQAMVDAAVRSAVG